MHEDDDTVRAALGAGAVGYLLKGANGTDITAAIRSAAAGQAVFGATLASRLRSWVSSDRDTRTVPFPELTKREHAILDQLAAGHSNAAIGERLHLSTKTVANNVSNILNKLHLLDRSEAIVRARGRTRAGARRRHAVELGDATRSRRQIERLVESHDSGGVADARNEGAPAIGQSYGQPTERLRYSADIGERIEAASGRVRTSTTLAEQRRVGLGNRCSIP